MVAAKKRKCAECGKMNAVPPARYCPTCKRKKKAASRAKSHTRHVSETYGLLPGEYDKILAAQGGVCYICGGRGGRKMMAVDHDHNLEGRESVRAILCQQCNYTLLGRIGKDDPARLRIILKRAIDVLENHPAQQILNE